MNRKSVKISRPSQDYVFGLDIIRFAAAFLVMAFHLGYWSWAQPTGTTAAATQHLVYLPSMSIFSAGWSGVEVFFLISGFVIASSAVGSDPWSFARSRLLRLAPTIWIIAPVTFVSIWLLHTRSDENIFFEFLRAMALVFFPPWLDGVYWTLGIEISFYICVLLLLFDQWTPTEISLRRLAIGLIAMSSVYWACSLLGLAGSRWLTKLLLFEHGCQFGAGIGLWLATRPGQRRAGFAILAFAIPSCVLQISGAAEGLSKGASTFPEALAIWICGLMAISASAFWRPVINGAKAKIIRNLGLATFPLYLVHNCIGGAFLGVLTRSFGNGLVALWVAFAFSIGLALIVSILAEPPLRRKLATLLDRTSGLVRRAA